MGCSEKWLSVLSWVTHSPACAYATPYSAPSQHLGSRWPSPGALVGKVKVTDCYGTSGKSTGERGQQRQLLLLLAMEYPWWAWNRDLRLLLILGES